MSVLDLKLAIYESIKNNEIDQVVGYKMLDVYETDSNLNIIVDSLEKDLEKEKLDRATKVFKNDQGGVSVKTYDEDLKKVYGSSNAIKDKIKKLCEKYGKCEINEDDDKIYFDITCESVDIFTEGVFSNPLRKSLKIIKEIKDAKPKSYNGPIEIKNFIDKYYNEIIKISKMAEKEPKDIRSSDIKIAAGTIVSIVAGFGLMMAYAFSALEIMPLFYASGIVAILSIVIDTVYPLIKAVRINNDIKATDDLSKIRDALNKLDTAKLPEQYKNKIADVVEAINDADTEISTRFKVAKESVINEKLKIYEAHVSGQITESQRDELLDHLTDVCESFSSGTLSVADKTEIKSQVNKACQSLYRQSHYKENIKKATWI